VFWQTPAPPPAPPQSLLLVSERNSRHLVGVVRYLRRAGALLPPELLAFTLGVLEARERARTARPLCTWLKSLGVCRSLTSTSPGPLPLTSTGPLPLTSTSTGPLPLTSTSTGPLPLTSTSTGPPPLIIIYT